MTDVTLVRYFHHSARLTSWRTLMAYLSNGEECINKVLSPGHLRGELNH